MNKDYQSAKAYLQKAAAQSPERCFPNRIEEVCILQEAIRLNPSDAKAPYYLGNFWYAFRQYDQAIACWQQSAQVDAQFPTVLRNLALAYYNKLNDKPKAQHYLEQAFALDQSDARVFMELDQLYKKIGRPYAQRLALLEKHLPLVLQRDDLYIERLTLYSLLGKYETACKLIDQHIFHPWEGGEGKVTAQYCFCRVEMAKKAIAEQEFDQALRLLKETESYPHNLGEGKLSNAQENEIYYYKALAYQGRGDIAEAKANFDLASMGDNEPQQVFFYNDQQPDKIFYQGLAWRQLGHEDKARSCFHKLIAHGEKHLFDTCKIDYFAVSLPDLAIWDDDLNTRNQVHCFYVMALGYSGLGQDDKAEMCYNKVKALDMYKQVYRR